jgi:hypothetical protein
MLTDIQSKDCSCSYSATDHNLVLKTDYIKILWYTLCTRRYLHYFRKMFLRLNYFNISKHIYI